MQQKYKSTYAAGVGGFSLVMLLISSWEILSQCNWLGLRLAPLKIRLTLFLGDW